MGVVTMPMWAWIVLVIAVLVGGGWLFDRRDRRKHVTHVGDGGSGRTRDRVDYEEYRPINPNMTGGMGG